MPRGKKVAPKDERAWLEAYEEGKSVEAIAREARRASSTVKLGIKRARQEGQARQTWEGLLREAYQRHFEDLLGMARGIEKRAAEPKPGGLSCGLDRRARMLREGLESHLPKSHLWKAMKEWEVRAEAIENSEGKIKGQLADLVRKDLPADVQPLFRQEGLLDSLWHAASETAEGNAPVTITYLVEGGTSLHWGAFGLSSGPGDDALHEKMREHHRILLGHARMLESVARHRGLLQSWAQARDAIEEEVEVLLLRRLLPNKCKLCPQ